MWCSFGHRVYFECLDGSHSCPNHRGITLTYFMLTYHTLYDNPNLSYVLSLYHKGW